MNIKLGVVMDAIESIHFEKDSTLAMLLEAQNRGIEIYYMTQQDLVLRDGIAWSDMRKLKVYDDKKHWFDFENEIQQPLTKLDVILMRKDPPVDANFIYTTQILAMAEKSGVMVVNNPQALRDHNEKLFINCFPECCAPTLVTAKAQEVKKFLAIHHDIICKPLYGMGGVQVFRVNQQDPNLNVICEVLTNYGKTLMLAQKYIPEISEGDKRILLIDGKPYPYALARLAQNGETRANLAVGGKGVGKELSDRDRWICDKIGPSLRDKGLLFVGIDVIGDYLTEINITSPTCIRELDKIYQTNISAMLFDCIEKKISEMKK